MVLCHFELDSRTEHGQYGVQAPESRCGAVTAGPAYPCSAPFVWRCLTNQTVAPFPHPARRTERAGLPHSALGQDIMPSPTEGSAPRRADGSAPVCHTGSWQDSVTAAFPLPSVCGRATGAADVRCARRSPDTLC